MLTTNGGATDSTEALVSLLQALAPDLRVVVPHSAKSNGTMICLAANTILMGPPSELGPIDPSIAGTPTSILATPRVEAENYALHKLAIYAIQQTRKLATSLLSNGMMKDRNPAEIEETVDKLASRDHFHSHGSVIDHQEAKELGLSVEFMSSDDEIWQRFWLLHAMYSHDVSRSGALKIFEGRSRSATVVPN